MFSVFASMLIEHYIGMVGRVQSNKELIVNFMQKLIGVSKFIFPDEINMETITESTVVKVLE